MRLSGDIRSGVEGAYESQQAGSEDSSLPKSKSWLLHRQGWFFFFVKKKIQGWALDVKDGLTQGDGMDRVFGQKKQKDSPS